MPKGLTDLPSPVFFHRAILHEMPMVTGALPGTQNLLRNREDERSLEINRFAPWLADLLRHVAFDCKVCACG